MASISLSRTPSWPAGPRCRALVRSELAVDDDELLFLTVANLRPEKGYDVLLEAAKIIADC